VSIHFTLFCLAVADANHAENHFFPFTGGTGIYGFPTKNPSGRSNSGSTSFTKSTVRLTTSNPQLYFENSAGDSAIVSLYSYPKPNNTPQNRNKLELTRHRHPIKILRQLPLSLLVVVDSGITQDLHGAGAVTASFLKDGEAGGDSIGRCAGEGDAEGYAVFDALGAALALVC